MKKRLLGGLLVGILCLGLLSSCKSEGQGEIESELDSTSVESEEDITISSDFSDGTQIYDQNGIYFEVPKAWTKSENENFSYYYPPEGAGTSFLMVQTESLGGSIFDDSIYAGFIEGLKEGSGEDFFIFSETTDINSNDVTWRYVKASATVEDIYGEMEYALFDAPNDTFLCMCFFWDTSCNVRFAVDYDRIIDSVKFSDSSATASQTEISKESAKAETATESPEKHSSSGTSKEPQESKIPETPEKSETQTATSGQSNALKSAKNYLNVMAFSYTGLIEQLEYEGYTNAEAVYAVDNCGADWNQQALKSAKNYLNTMAFSYSGLIEQLEYEGFTNAQATYGANNCGTNWNEQAAKAAKKYLEMMSFSRDELISQLEYEGFTYEQAVYAAQANGY